MGDDNGIQVVSKAYIYKLFIVILHFAVLWLLFNQMLLSFKNIPTRFLGDFLRLNN